MRKKINQLAKGDLEEVKARIRLSESQITGSVPCGRSGGGEFSLSSENGIPFRGLVFADDERIEFPQDAFGGQQVSISYIIHAEDESDDTVLEGRFALVTNTGDIYVPYRFVIGHSVGEEMPLPATPQELARMTAAQPEQIYKLFEAGGFAAFPFLKDASLKALYEALRESTDKRTALEEFLVACGAKQPVKLKVEAEPLSFEYRPGKAGGEIRVSREGEGYVAITVQTDAPFIRLAKERWTGLDFREGQLSIPLSFVAEQLHAGQNLGQVILSTGREEYRIPVTVIPDRMNGEEEKRRRQLRRHTLQLAEAAVQLYAGENPPYNIETQILKLLDARDRLQEPGVRDMLIRAEILRQMNRRNEEKEALEQIRAEVQRNRTEKVTEYLWFLYLEEEREKGNRLSDGFLRLLYRLKDEAAGRAELLPLLMRSDSEWAERPEKCLDRMREHYRRGRFPLVLKLEAVRLLKEHPELLTETDPFMVSLLHFGARYECWPREIAEKAAALLAEQKGFRLGTERLMLRLYKAYPDSRMLSHLLAVLLRREKPRTQHLPWYEKGIREDVRLAEIYEYYLAVLPEDFAGDIPQMVQLYYTYNSPRSRRAQHTLYRYILSQYETDTQVYKLYEKQIQNYAMDQLLLGSPRESEAVFYEKMFIPQVLDSRMAVVLSEYVYTMHLSLANRSIEKILVIYGELKEPYSYPVKNGEAYIPVFTPQCRLLFVDKKGGRYTQTVFRREKLMDASRELMESLRRLAPGSLPFKLMQCKKALKGELTDWEAQDLVHRFPEWNELSEEYREKLIFSLVKRRNLGTAENAALLKELRRSPYLDARAGALLAESLLLQGDDGAAAEMVQRFGYCHFDTALLLRLMNRLIRTKGYQPDRNIYNGVLSLYRREVWDSVTLTYLCRHYNSGTAEMLKLLDRAKSGEALVYDLPERLLGQMLFTGETKRIDSVVELYLKETQAPKVPNRTLLHAYAVERCEKYFCRGESVPDNIFAYLASWAASEKKAVMLPELCQIALTKYHAEQESLSPEEAALSKTFLYHLYDKGLLFAYQEKLARFYPLPAELADKTLIEYRGTEEEPVKISFRILPQEQEEEGHITEMPHIFRGIYVKPVLLFADEELEYAILKGTEPVGALLEKGRIRGGRGSGENRFARLNRMIEGAQEEKSGWQEEIVEFGKRDVVLEEYFPLG